MQDVIQFKEVSKSFGSKLLLSGINFNISPGTLATLVGPNGAGKSTIAKIILGIEAQDSGTITRQANIKIGYVPQNFTFNTNLPITSDIFVKLLAPGKDIAERRELIDFSDFDKIKTIAISSLSRGQFQKLMLAASFLNRPDLIILDEPIQSLDVTSQQDFYNLVEDIRKRFNLTILMISHDLHTVMKNSDYVICLNGHICCSGKPGDLHDKEDFIKSMSGIGIYIHQHDHTH